MIKWRDVDPMDWFYRSVLESDSIKESATEEFSIIRSYPYGVFEDQYPRKVYTFTTTENQVEFACPGYNVHKENYVTMYIDGVLTFPGKLEKDKISAMSPLAGGIQVVIIVSGVPKLIKMGNEDCAERPIVSNCKQYYPFYELEEKDNYVYDAKYVLNEKVMCLGRSLRRMTVERNQGESVQDALTRVIGLLPDRFTIIDGYLYVSMNLNSIPMKVNYNYTANGVVKNRYNEPAVPNSNCVQYNERFFPYANMMKYEFYVILERMKHNLYHRYTDREYSLNPTSALFRRITDKKDIVGKWYEGELLNILEDKFSDGCYVYPLYEDDTFSPMTCITRAEMIVALSRFNEWALERFR